uniref:Uncharacterized protein n=1 Tax=Syphacia muris TaxID=451379 RepID=A0A0N5ALZ5_9BILA
MASIFAFVVLLITSLLVACNGSSFAHPQFVRRSYQMEPERAVYADDSVTSYFLERNGRALVEPKDETLYEIKHVADLPMFRFG